MIFCSLNLLYSNVGLMTGNLAAAAVSNTTIASAVSVVVWMMLSLLYHKRVDPIGTNTKLFKKHNCLFKESTHYSN
jgi:hypothetical protein